MISTAEEESLEDEEEKGLDEELLLSLEELDVVLSSNSASLLDTICFSLSQETLLS